MYKKLIGYMCVVLVFALASTSYGVLIGDFEGGSYDGWTGNVTGIVTVPSLTIGVTSGSGSLGVYVPQQGVPYWALKRDGIVDFTGMTEFTLDVTFIASEWLVNYNWLKVDKLAINSDGISGWKEFINPIAINRDDLTTCPLDFGPWYPLQLTPNRTYSWDLTTLVGGYDATGATYMKIIVALQNPNAFAT